MPLPPRAPPRPRLAFRLGITGARPNRLDPMAIPLLRAHLTRVLRLVRTTIDALASGPEVRAAYAPDPPLLRLLSPLAEGSDRIAAEAALAEGIRIEVPMPFAEDEYEKTFTRDPPSATPPFRTLLAAACTEDDAPAILALDGSRAADAEAGYRAVGRFVVRHCDLLIAIWDGQSGKPGGTAEIVRYAAQSHVPIWWIEAGGAAPPSLLLGAAGFNRRAAAPTGAAAEAALALLLRAALLPPAPGQPYHPTGVGTCVHRLARWLGYRREPLPAYFAEREEPIRPVLWRAYGWALDRIAPETAPPTAAPAPVESAAPADEVETAWADIYAAADRHGSKYADRYRSSYVLIIALAALTVAAMGAALAFPRSLGRLATGVELAGLVGILLIVSASELWRWHERWIAYRLLAELCRKQRTLARIGWSLPAAQVAELAGHPEPGSPPRDAWVAWYVTAAMRGSPLPHGAIADHIPRARYLGRAMIAAQTAYHRRRRDRSRTAAHRLVRIGEAFFGLTLGLVALKFILLLEGDWSRTSGWFGFACVTLAALSAGFVSLRSYAEFDLLHLQSEQMLRVLAATAEELEALDLTRPLASQSLGAVLHALALAMLHDVEGWSLLFRTKTPETG